MPEKLVLFVFNEFVDMARAAAWQRPGFALVPPGRGAPKKNTFFHFFLAFVCKIVKIPACVPEGKRKPPSGESLAENRKS